MSKKNFRLVKIDWRNSSCRILIGGMYNFYGDTVRVTTVIEDWIFFVFKTGDRAGKYNRCQIEEFVLQNPEIVE